MEQKTPSERSGSDSPPASEPVRLHDASSPYALDLPVAPAWFSEPPNGSWEAGYRLSLAALEMVKNRPEIFEERTRQMVDVEFVW